MIESLPFHLLRQMVDRGCAFLARGRDGFRLMSVCGLLVLLAGCADPDGVRVKLQSRLPANQAVLIQDGKMRACGAPLEVINASMLREVYGVDARIEKCSRQFDHVIVDGVAAA